MSLDLQSVWRVLATPADDLEVAHQMTGAGVPAAGIARVSGVGLAYEAFGNRSHEAMLLIAGLGAQMITWPLAFCVAVAERGFWVVRYDNRDVGLSDSVAAAGYTTGDMAEDAAGLMSALGLASAHVVGLSVGGIIAQELVVRHPERVRSLALVSSTPDLSHFTELASSVGSPPAGVGRDAFIEHWVAEEATYASPAYPLDRDSARQVGGIIFDRGWRPEGKDHHIHALLLMRDLTESLGSMSVPVVVVHGDADPLIRLSGAVALAEAIPGAELRVVEGMGHALPRLLLDYLAELVAANARRRPAAPMGEGGWPERLTGGVGPGG